MKTKIKDKKSSRITFSVGLILLGCSGCSTLPSQHRAEAQSIPFSQRHKTVNALSDFTVSGKVGFIRDEKGGSASLDWQQQGTQYLVRLYGPFGSESVTLQGNVQHITLTRANGQRLEANNPETLVQQALGLNIPVSGLRYWLKGVPAPGKLKQDPKINAEGLIVGLEQEGWIIHYDAYAHYTHPTLGTISLPQKIQLEHFNNKHSQKTKLKFVLQKWSF